MEYFPVEVIGNILSHLEGVRNLVIASATCRKWQEAWKNHTHTLTIDYVNVLERILVDGTTRRQEIIIIRNIIAQTSRLECLLITMGGKSSIDPVIYWLTYVKDTLRELYYRANTSTKINIFEKCDIQKLEVLTLDGFITLAECPNYKIFPYLRHLSFSCSIRMSALDLRLLLTACPKIEFLSLDGVHIANVGIESFHLSSNSLKDIHLILIDDLGKFILAADNIERMHLEILRYKSFELVGKGTLKYLKIEDIKGSYFDISKNVENLEVVDASYCYYGFEWAKFESMISKSLKLRRLRIWQVDDSDMIVDMDAMVACFPLLSHLSCTYREGSIYERCYHERYNRLHKDLYSLYRNDDDLKEAVVNELIEEATRGGGGSSSSSSQLQNLVVLKLEWPISYENGDSTICHEFSGWIATVLEKCPNLRKLIICGAVTDITTDAQCRSLANFTTSIVRLMRKYMHIEVEFEWD